MQLPYCYTTYELVNLNFIRLMFSYLNSLERYGMKLISTLLMSLSLGTVLLPGANAA